MYRLGSLIHLFLHKIHPGAEPCVVPGTFSSSRPLTGASTILSLILLVSFPSRVVTPVSLVWGPLQDAHKSMHFDC
jgi:hypothetical protein